MRRHRAIGVANRSCPEPSLTHSSAALLSKPQGAQRSRSGRPRRGERELRIEAFLDVAEAHFLQHGYVATSIDKLARAAAISKKTIYDAFGDKPGLFKSVVVRIGERLMAGGLPEPDDLPLRDGLMLRLRRINAASVQPAALALNMLLASEGRAFPDIAEILHGNGAERYRRPFADYLRSCVARGLIRPMDCEFAANAILAVLSRHLTYAVLYGTPIEDSDEARETLLAQTCDFAIQGLLGAPEQETAQPG